MAANKHLIGQGIGFSPGSVKFVIWDGLAAATVVAARHIIGLGIGLQPGAPSFYVLGGLGPNAGGATPVERRWAHVWVGIGIRI